MSERRRITKRPQAESDITELFGYLLDRNQTAARNFLKEVRLAFDLILRVPGIGRRWDSPYDRIKELRVTTISRRFHDYLIFYFPTDQGIEIVRVMHGARDLTALIDSLPDVTDLDQT